ncbi:MAG: sigma-70 family RNA polymerase sigma factor [Bacteroidetes bacterium]|nr:sigma-70 family RNA polymerase sigma factor [Bacteroidota bacterium]
MNKPLISDEELVAQYIQGNEACLKTLLIRHKSQIFTSIFYLVNDRYLAEDFFQETFIKVINTLRAGKYKESGKFLPWVMRIARNLVMDHFRKTKTLPTVVDSDGVDVFTFIRIKETNAEEKMVRKETQDKGRQLIEHLPEDQRETLVLRHYAGLSFKEIAAITGTNTNTSLARMRYALKGMRKLIEKHNIIL